MILKINHPGEDFIDRRMIMYINIEGWVEKCLIVDHANVNYNNDASYEIQ